MSVKRIIKRHERDPLDDETYRNQDKLIVNELRGEGGEGRREEVRGAQRAAAAATAAAAVQAAGEDPRIRRRDSSFSVSREASGGRGEDERKGQRDGEEEEARERGRREVSRYIRRGATSLTRRGRVE